MRFTLNGKRVDVDAPPMMRLLDVLRTRLGLTGTKEGCGEGEGIRAGHPLLRAFVEEGAVQCGMCTPGMVMAAAALGARPDEEAIRRGLAGNLCRCTGYGSIVKAVHRAGRRT